MFDSSKSDEIDVPVTFRTLLVELAHRVGDHHIPVNTGANDIHEFVGVDAVHHELVNQIVRQIYKANRCGHLDAEVSHKPTFAVLGRIRGQLSQCRQSDIDQVNLLDALGWAVREIFANHELIPNTVTDEPLESRASIHQINPGYTP
ncbi:MAG: hypothetical protein OES09_04525 [Gammaproteobacteria bacterium]|nr:hypothetical protein [Gammaproteobacteria bacterium]